MNDDYETPRIDTSRTTIGGADCTTHAFAIDDPSAFVSVEPAPPPSITEEAERIINGPRRDDYGPVEESFQQIATMWSALFGKEITSKDVALAMICLKVCRESGPKHTRDSLVDIVGYTLLLEKIEQGS